MKTVDVSVLITNYNHEKYLPECLDAVFSQSVLPREVIVIDDASTDQSVSLIQKYQKKHRELIFLQNTVNQGPAKSMNLCISHSKGKYLFLGAADDKVLPGSFEIGAHYLDLYKDAGICCSIPTMFKNEKPYRYEIKSICKEKAPTWISAEMLKKRFLRTSLWIPSHSSLYQRDLIIKYGGLDDSLKHLCDWYLNCKIALTHGIVYVPRSFGAFRISTQSYSAGWNRSYMKKIKIYRRLFDLLAQESSLYQKVFCRSGALGLISSDFLIYLLLHVSLWKYIPFSFYRKLCNLFRKLKQIFISSNFSKT